MRSLIFWDVTLLLDGCYPTFRNILLVSFSGVKMPIDDSLDSSTIEGQISRLSRNVGH
jgi:hypothetical protein